LIRLADVPVLIGDNSKLRHDTGWEPGISIEQMIMDLMKYWKDVTATRAQ
jgi:nucleoside-diphosphate-sugar epimerase